MDNQPASSGVAGGDGNPRYLIALHLDASGAVSEVAYGERNWPAALTWQQAIADGAFAPGASPMAFTAINIGQAFGPATPTPTQHTSTVVNFHRDMVYLALCQRSFGLEGVADLVPLMVLASGTFSW